MTPLPNLRAATVVNQEKVWFVLGWNFSGANKENEKKTGLFTFVLARNVRTKLGQSFARNTEIPVEVALSAYW